MRRHPHLYEANARLFLRRLSEKYHRPLTLATIPEKEWQLLAHQGFDLVWLMGVWQRSPGARQEALHNAALRHEYDQVLPGWTEEDVPGSPYAIYAYRLDPALGRPEELARLKSRLHRHGLGLILDFVPNHLAFDHPWTRSYPERFVRGTEAAVRCHPDWFFSTKGRLYLAHGRDPYFPPWTDTAQVDFSSPDLRQAWVKELLRLAAVADGVRCDMAMLALNHVFAQVWGERVKGYLRPQTEFWAEAIGPVKRKRPDLLFLAEVYWGLERDLQQLGFDFTYDKLLYDQLRFGSPSDIRNHLRADALYQQRSVRFIENHDEPRAVVAFGRERSLAAAMVMATLPGLRLFHDGQREGRRLRLPIQLGREPPEAEDQEIRRFYDRLLAICQVPAFHEGDWTLLEANPAWEGNESHHNLLVWVWCYAAQCKVVAVNYSPHPAQGWLRLPLPRGNPEKMVFQDELTGATYIRDSNEVRSKGLYVDLAPWRAHLLDMAPG